MVITSALTVTTKVVGICTMTIMLTKMKIVENVNNRRHHHHHQWRRRVHVDGMSLRQVLLLFTTTTTMTMMMMMLTVVDGFGVDNMLIMPRGRICSPKPTMTNIMWIKSTTTFTSSYDGSGATTLLRLSNNNDNDKVDDIDNDDSSSDSGIEIENDESEESLESLSILDKINKFLDTPILDANNRSNQGQLSELLKEFVRDEPELAQVTFSAIVVALLFLIFKLLFG